jgi:hypothetical protein
MLYGRYVFSCEFQTDAVLPEYKGSTFRGLFGHALKKVVCALKRQDCRDCLLRAKCIYVSVFEAPPITSDGRRRIAAPPHPYVIEPPDIPKTHFRPGESLEFAILLFGVANDYLPYFIYAFEQMAEFGIGKRIDEKRGGFVLKQVNADGQTVYSNHDQKLRAGPFARELFPDKSIDDSLEALDLTLATPLRLKYHNSLEADLPFHVLVRAMLRRISSLYQYHGAGEPTLDYRGLVERAKTVSTTSSSIRWFDWRRYSNKQDQAMLMGGMIGRIRYEGDLTEFMPLLRFCETVHLGKQTTFGLGKIRCSPPSPSRSGTGKEDSGKIRGISLSPGGRRQDNPLSIPLPRRDRPGEGDR